VQPRAVLLDAGPRGRGYMHQHGHHHSLYVCDVYNLRGLRSQFRYSSGLPNQRIEYESKLEDCANSNSEHGMHVCTGIPLFLSSPHFNEHANTHNSASAAVIVRLAYVPTFRDPDFLYATVPIAIWSEVEMSLAITAGSLPTLRPLYRVVATKLSLKTSFFSTRRSNKDIEAGNVSKWGVKTSNASSKDLGLTSFSESERTMVKKQEFVLEEYRPVTQGKFMEITKVTNVQVNYEDGTIQ
jgi:hypothetical protein